MISSHARYFKTRGELRSAYPCTIWANNKVTMPKSLRFRLQVSMCCSPVRHGARLRMPVEILLVFELLVDFARIGDVPHVAEVVFSRAFPVVRLGIALA